MARISKSAPRHRRPSSRRPSVRSSQPDKGKRSEKAATRGAAAPRLPDAGLAPLVRSLRQVAEGLQYAQQSFSDALLRLPRAEDYEPLVAPLREFARISPALVEALRAVVELGGGSRPLAVQSQGVSATTSAVPTRVEEALRCVEAAHEAVRSALAALPGESDYRPVASQLRELATVSPSLMEWLREVPRLAAPLRGSVQALRRAADDLRSASDLLRDVAGEPT